MVSPFITALRAEIDKLERDLRENIVYQRLIEAKRMLALYEQGEPDTGRYDLSDLLESDSNPPIRRQNRTSAPERAKALEAARLFLANRGSGPTPTSAIYDHIASLGLEIGGKEPRNNLSAMLSNSPVFVSNGRLGWTLAPEVANEAANTDLMRDLDYVDEPSENSKEENG